MYTLIYELYRRAEEFTQEEFVAYWLTTHKPIAMKMPRVKRYEIWPVTESSDVEGEAVAGFVILAFDSKKDFDFCHESQEFADTAEDALKFARRFTRYSVDTHEVV